MMGDEKQLCFWEKGLLRFMLKKWICLMLCITTLALPLLACGADPAENVSAPDTPDTSLTASGGGTSAYVADVPVVDLDGRVFRVLCRDYGYGSTSITGYNGEVIQRPDYDEATAGIVDQAKAEVRRRVEERYNCTIEGDFGTGDVTQFNDIVRNDVLSGSGIYDMVFDTYGYSSLLVTSNIYVDLNTIESLNFDQPWWDQNAKEDLSIDGKLFFMVGDINTYDNDGTWVILFNKDLKSDLGIEDDLYALARDGEWTFDKFTELCKGVTYDSNRDGVLDEFDTWGFATEKYNVFIHTLAAGENIVRKDENDIPYFSFQTETTYDALSKILDFYMDTNTVMIADNGRFDNKGYTNIWEETIVKAFREGRALFYCCGLMNVPGFRAMEDEFGILPVPKTNPEQDSYYHSVSMTNMSALCIPNNATDYTELGYIIESLAAESKNTVTPAYYEKNLKYQSLTDDESGEMLDIIFATRSFDLGTVFDWGGILGHYMKIDTDFVSRFEAVYPVAQAALEDTLEALENLN